MEMPSGRRSSDPMPRAREPAEGAQNRRHGRHHDRPETEQAGLVNRLLGAFPLFALGIQGKVDHHDAVLLDDADQKDDADNGDDVELGAAEHQSESTAPTPAEGRVERMVIGWM